MPRAEPIVERELELRSDDGERKVVARIWTPVPDGDQAFRCDFEIEGLGEPIAKHGMGIDAIQAYQLALEFVALYLYASTAYQSGRLTFQGAYDLQLPISESYRYLVRTDFERDRTVRQFAGEDEGPGRFAEANLARMQDTSRVWPDRPGDAPIILERTFELRRGRKRTDVRVLFRKPVPHRLGHWCAFAIEGLLAKPHARTAMLGEDSIDALRNAMRMAMVYILSSPAYQRGQLTHHGGYDLGLPVLEEVEPLIRKDLQAKFMAKLLMDPPMLRQKAALTRDRKKPKRPRWGWT